MHFVIWPKRKNLKIYLRLDGVCYLQEVSERLLIKTKEKKVLLHKGLILTKRTELCWLNYYFLFCPILVLKLFLPFHLVFEATRLSSLVIRLVCLIKRRFIHLRLISFPFRFHSYKDLFLFYFIIVACLIFSFMYLFIIKLFLKRIFYNRIF